MTAAGRARYRVAVIGGGPSGFYAAEALLRSGQSVDVDMFERLPVPYGLVRFGVAPDHPKLKLVTRVFDRIAEMPGFRFFGGVEIGATVTISALRSCYHAVILATGAPDSRLMDIPGEGLSGSHQAGDFVAWYNGHPDFRHLSFDLAAERAVIIGHGNVALDVARILAKTPDELRHTDIAAHALDALAASNIREIYLVGRRGPGQTRFAAKELQEFAELADCDPVVDPAAFDDVAPEPNADDEAEAVLAMLREFAIRPVTKRRRCVFLFDLAPLDIEGDGRVQLISFGQALGQRALTLDCGLVFSSIGRRATPVDGIPYDDARGIHANIGGRLAAADRVLPGLYVCGWGKRGSQGTIGTNRGCSVETVANVLADLPQLAEPPSHPDNLLAGTPVRRFVDYPAWMRIDAEEVARGGARGKPREKFIAIDEMFAAAGGGVAC
jgi:ferredoxin--NADP+ reductase